MILLYVQGRHGMQMTMGTLKKRLVSRRQSRIQAGLLALMFLALSLFPTLHVLSEHGSHGVSCQACAAEVHTDSAMPALSGTTAAGESCSGCQILSHLQLFDSLDGTPPATPVYFTPFAGQAPDAPVLANIYRANRAQAPPDLA